MLNRRAVQVAGWTLASAAAYSAAFVLPYRFPLREPVLSDTWIAGANNQAAAIGLATVSAIVTLACRYRDSLQPAEQPAESLSPRLLLGGIVAAIAWTATLGWAVARAHTQMYWGDEGYFLNQLRTGLVFHRNLYSQFEFAYGPALYLWPALFIRALAPFGIGMTAAYLISLALLQAIGLALLFYTVQALPLRRGLKAFAFVLIAIGSFNSLLGLNYTVFRFILPAAAIVMLSRRKRWSSAAAIAFIAEMALLAVSPELGVAFAGGAIAHAAWRALHDGRDWLFTGVAAIAGAALFLAIVLESAGRDFLLTFASLARGGYNGLLLPVPAILALIFGAIVLAPLAVARLLRSQTHGGLALALYAASLGMLPGAMGRCDAIHVFFGGIGLWLLSLVALEAAPLRWRSLTLILLAVLFASTQLQNLWLYRYRLGIIAGAAPPREDVGFDEQRLLAAIGSAKISAPLLAPQRAIDDLTRTGQFVPGYFCGWIGVWDRAAEERKIADMRQADFALISLSDPPAPNPAADRRIALAMRLGLANHPPRPPYVRGEFLSSELRTNWRSLGRFGDYELFKQTPRRREPPLTN